jgi:hypothetical protein
MPARPPSFPDELPSATLLDGRYEIAQTLGRGGFAFTYKACDRRTGNTVAIKEIFPKDCRRTGGEVEPLTADARWALENSPRWLRNEAQILRRFKDPSIVEVRRTFEEHETVYVVMEFIDGVNLEEEAEEAGGRLSPQDTIRRLRRILHALKIVHSGNVLHRDLKPSNVMRTVEGRIVLIDFGAAREEHIASHTASTVMITPGYAAPEQREAGGRKTFATDLFAVGAIGFRLLSGQRPGSDADARNPDMKTLIETGHSRLVRTIGWALEPDPRYRPKDAERMLDALEGIRSPGHGIFDGTRRRMPRPPTPRPPRPEPTPRRERWFPRHTPEELSKEARRLAAGARWPVAALAATPGLILPFLTGAVYLAAIALLWALTTLRSELRRVGSGRQTAATALFLLPRLTMRLLGGLLGGLFRLLGELLFIAVLAAFGAGVAAAYTAIGVLLQGQHLDHAAFMSGFYESLPRTAVSMPVMLLTASRIKGDRRALVKRAATAAACVTESSVVTLWVLGVGVPAVVVLIASCHTWAPFREHEQALLWVEARVPLVADIDNAITGALVESQISEAVNCSSATQSYGKEIERVGKRSFLVSVALEHRALEHLAQERASAGVGNAEDQVAITALVLARLDSKLSQRVRVITVRVGDVADLPSGKVSLSHQAVKLVLRRPHGPVTDGTAAAALAAASSLFTDPTLGAAAGRLERTPRRMPAMPALCG